MTLDLVARGLRDLRAQAPRVLGLHLAMQLAGLAVFTPLLAALLNALVYSAGERVVSNYDIASLLLTPVGLATIPVAAALFIGLTLTEFAGLTWLAGHALLGRSTTLLATLRAMAVRLPLILRLAGLVFLQLLVLLLPFLAVAGIYWVTLLAGRDINYYLAENPPEWQRAMLLLAGLGAVYAALAARRLAGWLYAIPVLLYEQVPPRTALARSAALTRGHLHEIVPPILLLWLGVTVGTVLLAVAGRELTDAMLENLAGLNLRRVLPIVASCMAVSITFAVLAGALQLGGHQFLVTRLFAARLAPGREVLPGLRDEPGSGQPFRAVAALALVVLALTAVLIVALPGRGGGEAAVLITAHRGAALDAPENSLAAFQAAMDAGADYIELDVQRTADGAVAVLHDADLLRMAGDPRRIRALTAADLSGIDIGSKRGDRYRGERVPLLRDVIALTRGRMRLNIELKYNGRDPLLAPAVVALLREESHLDQVVITSLDYAALKQVAALEPLLVTGHIITAALGNVARTEADFVSLNSARATPAVTRRAHAAGKDVHVWTVNDADAMLRMVERGADNIITDDPALLRRLLDQRAELDGAERLGLRLRVLFDKAPAALSTSTAVPAL